MMPHFWQIIGLLGALACVGGLLAVCAKPIAKSAFFGLLGSVARHPVLALMIIAAVAYGSRKGHVTYPRTSPEVAYLQDEGSYVASNILHVAFTRLIVPDSAALFIDFRAVTNETDDTAWRNFISTTFAEFAAVGQSDFEFENATNFDWVVYTDWTPGPAVQTNGVWHANWGLDRKTGGHIIPVRTAIRLDGETIATPKSREDAKNHENE